jgi:DNA polymerase/3'-5' exonuclease PolX
MKGTDCIGLPRGTATTSKTLSNAEIADYLAALAQLLSANGENPHKIRAYRRAAGTIRRLSESLDELVRSDGDLTTYAGIGKAISGAVREIVLEGSLWEPGTVTREGEPRDRGHQPTPTSRS